ncbi:MAG: hypothetical protein ACFFCW_36380 [Candidatus Hodarchaeota archaeon]
MTIKQLLVFITSGMIGQDIYFSLNGEMWLADVIREKVSKAARDGNFYVSVYESAIQHVQGYHV